MTDNNGRTVAAHMAAALKLILENDSDALPHLPTGKQMKPAARSVAQRQPPHPGPANANQPVTSTPRPMRPASAPAAVPAPPLIDDFVKTLPDNLALLRERIADCHRCELHLGRTGTVFGEGPSKPTLMIVGESPGPIEDRNGRPFLGESGELLDKIITAMGLNREKDCYLTTVLKCITSEGQPPAAETVNLCRPFLAKQIELVQPRFLLAMGQTAAAVLVGSTSITPLRGRFLTYNDIPTLVTYHPSALLREPTLKKLVWADVKLIMARLKD